MRDDIRAAFVDVVVSMLRLMQTIDSHLPKESEVNSDGHEEAAPGSDGQ